MNQGILARAIATTIALTSIAALACSDSGAVDPSTPPLAKQANQGASGGGDTSHTPPPPPSSNGPVASVQLTPKALTIAVGNYGWLQAVGLDASGVAVRNVQVSWRASDQTIVAVADTGVVRAKAVGSTKVYATINGHTDSAVVTVIPGTPPPPPPTPQPGIATFDLNALVVSPLPGPDTSRTEPVAGALVKLTRIGGVAGDTLSQPADAGSATSDATGAVSFHGLPGGSYSIDIVPPLGSSYVATRTGLAPPHSSPITLRLIVPRKS